jgi:hypothetical protein
MINVFFDEVDADWEVWIDVDQTPRSGCCIGVGETERDALLAAIAELHNEIASIDALVAKLDAANPL